MKKMKNFNKYLKSDKLITSKYDVLEYYTSLSSAT